MKTAGDLHAWVLVTCIIRHMYVSIVPCCMQADKLDN